MTEVVTEVPQTGTRLRIDADRQFEGQPGDSTLRIAGTDADGNQRFDASYIEVNADEAKLVSWMLRALKTPQPEALDQVAQDIQATFGSKLSGRDAHQAAEVMWQTLRRITREIAGRQGEHEQYLDRLAERFERVSSRAKSAYAGAGSAPNGGS